MNSIFQQIYNAGIVPVAVINNKADALPLAQALCEGGLPCIEITFRTPAAADSIALISEKYPGMLVGAGTVLTIENVDKAVNAGAKFIVSPGFDKEIVDYCIMKNIPVLPGIMTPSDAIQAVKAGLEAVKFFPAEQAGGIAMVKALAAPYTMLKFLPTGGINSENVKEYLKFDKVIACGGSWMINSSYIDSGNFEKIKELTKQAKDIVNEIRKQEV